MPTAAVNSSYRQVLRHRPLALLLSGDALSKVGDGMIVVALPLLTLRIHAGVGAAIAVALIEAAPSTLSVPLSLVLGLSRWRFPPRASIVVDCLTRAVIFNAIGILAFTGALRLWLLGVALTGGSVLRLLAASSRRLLATGMADADGRFAINGLLGTSDALAAYVAGPVLGGLLSTATSPGFVLLLDGCSFLALLAVVLFTAPQAKSTVDDKTRSGWAILRRTPAVAAFCTVVFLFNFFYMPVEVALPLLVRGPLHASGAALGQIWTGFGVGALVGALATNQLRRLPQTMLCVCIIAGWGACVLLLATATDVPVAACALAVGGLIYAPFTPVAYSLVQAALAPDEQLPVLTLWAAVSSVAAPIGLVLAGPLIQATGLRPALVVSATLTLALAPAAAIILRRRGMR